MERILQPLWQSERAEVEEEKRLVYSLVRGGRGGPPPIVDTTRSSRPVAIP